MQRQRIGRRGGHIDDVAALGFEGVDYDGGEDLELGRARQAALNAADARRGFTWRPLVADGLCGPASVQAMRRHGYERWRDVECRRLVVE